MFFFEKKNQKTVIRSEPPGSDQRGSHVQKCFASFFRKKKAFPFDPVRNDFRKQRPLRFGKSLTFESLAVATSAKAVFKPILGLDLQLHTAIATAGEPKRPTALRFLAMCMDAA